jgi:PAS domain S-box-containing protein
MPLRRQVLVSLALATAILATARQIELHSAAAVPFALTIGLAYASGSARWVWIMAVLASSMAVGGALTGRTPDERGRLIAGSLFSIWLPAYPCAQALKEKKERERLAGIVDWSGDAIISRTLDGKITSWNRGAEALYGYRPEEIVGQPHAPLVPDDRRDELRDVLERLERGEPIVQYETVRLRKGGERVDVSLTISPIRSTEGALVGASTIARDTTEQNRLAATQRELSRDLERHVEERTAELARANEALARSNLDLQQFAYVASHDLQTPLRAIAGFAQALQADYQARLDATAQDYIERIVRGASRLQELIQDLLEFSRVDSPGTPSDAVDMNQAFRDAIECLRPAIETADAEVRSDSLPTVQGNLPHFTHLLQNLIENALKYRGQDPPQVRVSAQRQGGDWRITVTDNGIGIAPQYHERIFEIFRRLHTTHAYPGTGIGLSLCRRIVNRYGGRIWVEGAEGAGSSFHFTIPDQPVLAGVGLANAGPSVLPAPAEAVHNGGGL